MTKNISIPWLIITILLLGLGINTMFQLHSANSKKRELKEDYARLISIQNGLLNIDLWKGKVMEIIRNKLNSFDLSFSDNETLKAAVENILKDLLKNMLDGYRTDNDLFGIQNQIITKTKSYLNSKIPGITNSILKSLDKDENKAKLKELILDEVNKLIGSNAEISSYNPSEINALDVLFFENKKESIKRSLEEYDEKTDQQTLLIILAFGLSLLVLLLTPAVKRGGYQFFLVSVFSFVVLFGGVSFPMIDIDARIDSIDIVMLGETIEFGEQSLYFQSKSILDIAVLLVKEKDVIIWLVGALIILFSIAFPTIKTMLSIFVAFRAKMPTNRFVNFFVFQSGKWSMADVFVVAIFMAFIGFKSILDAQVKYLGGDNENINAIATNHTSTQEGFALFLAFVLGSMLIAAMLKQKVKMNNN